MFTLYYIKYIVMETAPLLRPTKPRKPKKPKGKIPKKIKNQTTFEKKPCPKGHTVCSCH